MASGSGGGVKIFLALLIIAVGAGGFNYYRNYTAEVDGLRPFEAYSDADLERLINAYKGEVTGLARRYSSAKSERRDARDTGYLDSQIAEFERVQRAGRRTRELSGELSEQEAALQDLEHEWNLREKERDPVGTLLRRIFTI